MPDKKTKKSESCCRIESILTVDERGQMVMPKDIREKAGIKPGDKLALVSIGPTDKPCCYGLIKADQLGEKVSDFFTPFFSGS